MTDSQNEHKSKNPAESGAGPSTGLLYLCLSLPLSLCVCVCVTHVRRMTMTPGAEADRKQEVQCGGQSDGQTEQHIPPHTHTHDKASDA